MSQSSNYVAPLEAHQKHKRLNLLSSYRMNFPPNGGNTGYYSSYIDMWPGCYWSVKGGKEIALRMGTPIKT